MNDAHRILLNPIFSEIVEEYEDRIKFVRLNVLESPENQQLATGQGVMGTPTLMFFCQKRSLRKMWIYAETRTGENA
jgi:thiol-disulfide isomerase/thioredoxin